MGRLFEKSQIDLCHLFTNVPELFESSDAFWDLWEKGFGEIDHASAFRSWDGEIGCGVSWVACLMAVTSRLAADAALKAHEAALEHGCGELTELSLEALPTLYGITNVLNHTLDYIIRKETCQVLLQGFLRF